MLPGEEVTTIQSHPSFHLCPGWTTLFPLYHRYSKDCCLIICSGFGIGVHADVSHTIEGHYSWSLYLLMPWESVHWNVLLSLLFLSYSLQKISINLQYRFTGPPRSWSRKWVGAPQPRSRAQNGARCCDTSSVTLESVNCVWRWHLKNLNVYYLSLMWTDGRLWGKMIFLYLLCGGGSWLSVY